MERVTKIFTDFKDAEEHDILSEISLTPEERLNAAIKLREQYYGIDTPDVKDTKK